MTLEEINKKIEEMEKNLKKLKEERNKIKKWDVFKDLRNEFYEKVENGFNDIKSYRKREHLVHCYADSNIISAFVMRTIAWKRIYTGALKEVADKGHKKYGLKYLNEDEIEEVRTIIESCVNLIYRDIERAIKES